MDLDLRFAGPAHDDDGTLVSDVDVSSRGHDPDGARVAAVAQTAARSLSQVRVRFDGECDGEVFGVRGGHRRSGMLNMPRCGWSGLCARDSWSLRAAHTT